MYKKKLGPDKTASQEIDITHESIAERKEFYQVLTRNVGIRILLGCIIPIMLTSGILCWRFHLAYSDKISAHICELVPKHTQNIGALPREKLDNIRYLARMLPTTDPKISQQFLTSQLSELKNGYGDVFTDIGIVDSDGIQFAYEGPFRLINADCSEVSWFLKAKENPDSISDVFAGIRGSPHFILAVKRSAQGRTYLLRSTIHFTAFNSLVENAQISRTGTTFIINANGELQTFHRSGTTKIVSSSIADIRLPVNVRHTAKPSTRDTANNGPGPSLVFTPRHGPQQNMKVIQQLIETFI